MASCPARQISAIKRRQTMSEDEAAFTCDYSRLSLAETVFSMANRWGSWNGISLHQEQSSVVLQVYRLPLNLSHAYRYNSNGFEVYTTLSDMAFLFAPLNDLF
ncbi:hypothetical protein CDAR_8421 [Caerostris darwini]|uniref:Uncharacterized protein n=1 Tax=Caerostris darwini TaxID=1538125 RepID=A0AAV4WTB1_9ARAC|nr:hypothetical protein CDAR_8421 [Caerostris darwini]